MLIPDCRSADCVGGAGDATGVLSAEGLGTGEGDPPVLSRSVRAVDGKDGFSGAVIGASRDSGATLAMLVPECRAADCDGRAGDAEGVLSAAGLAVGERAALVLPRSVGADGKGGFSGALFGASRGSGITLAMLVPDGDSPDV